jgi:hypothetical protein
LNQENSFSFLGDPIEKISLLDQIQNTVQPNWGLFQCFFNSAQENAIKNKIQDSQINESQAKTNGPSAIDEIFDSKKSREHLELSIEDSETCREINFSDRSRFTKVHDRGKFIMFLIFAAELVL